MILAFSIWIHFSLTKCSLISSITSGSLYGFDGSKSSGSEMENPEKKGGEGRDRREKKEKRK
ncbi:hypothetical protein ACJW30_04G148400 [Castanea mollissima]